MEVLEWPAPLLEFGVLLEKLHPSALLLYADQALEHSTLARQMTRLNKHHPTPILLIGAAASLHAHTLSTTVSNLVLAATPASVFHYFAPLRELS